MPRILLRDLLLALGWAGFRSEGGGWFVPLAESLPTEFATRLPQLAAPRVDLAAELPYLGQFLEEAQAIWSGGEVPAIRSGVWSETDARGEPCPLRAHAVRLGEHRAVLLQIAEADHERERKLVQRARESRLEAEQSERQQAEALAEANLQLEAELQRRREINLQLIEYQRDLKLLNDAVGGAAEEERRRLATLLHDDVGQRLAAAKIQLGFMGTIVSDDNSRRCLAEMRQLLDETIACTRSLTAELAPPMLDELGLEAALQSLVERVGERDRIAVTFADDGADKPLAGSLRTLLYQSVRELLHNVVKHAAPEHAEVRTQREGGWAVVSVADDGRGFAEETARRRRTGGFGLFSVAERMEQAGGRMEIESTPGEGTRIALYAPICDDPEDGD